MIPPFEIFGKTFGIYPILALIGTFAAGIYACRMTRKFGNDDNDMIVLLLFSALGALVGGHLLYGITNSGYFIKLLANLSNFTLKEILMQLYGIFGGAVFYGGLLGGIAVGLFYIKRKKWDLDMYADILAPAAPLLHLFGRIGCFLGGCCYGIESRFGFYYTQNIIIQANGVRRFPVQLLEALFNLCLFLLLANWLKKGAHKGMLFYTYLFLYSIGRFFLEFLRGDTYRGFLLGLSTSQWVSIFLFLVSSYILLRRHRQRKTMPA